MNVTNVLQVAIGTVCNGQSSPPVGLHLILTDVDTVGHQRLKTEVLNMRSLKMLDCECVCKELFPGKKNSRCCQVTTATVTSCRGTREDLYKCPVWSHNYENLFFNKVYYKPNVQLYACHHNLPFLA